MDVAEIWKLESPDLDSGELIKNLLVRTASENSEFSA